jgi:hypothetical protein
VRTLAFTVLACVATRIQSVGAQVTANVEAGVSDVQYDGFLASGAASLSPTMRWEHPQGRGFISARGTYLQFQSGRHSVDAAVNGSWFQPLARHWRGELGAAGGASQYATIASFNHGELETRLHLMDVDHGAWVGATAGRSSFGRGARPSTVIALGFWLLRDDKTMFVSFDRSLVGDTAYSDLKSSGRWRRQWLVLEGVLGARVWSRGGGRGLYGEGSATVSLSEHTALVLSAGRYPTDAVSGSIAGRYATLAIRMGTIAVRRPAPAMLPHVLVPVSGSDGGSTTTETALEIQRGRGDAVRLLLSAPGATTVEVSGDFTDWRPVSLTRTPAKTDLWQTTLQIPPGIHRINVRRDGGPWMAPRGTTRATDDFDGEVGVFTLP